MSQKSATEMGKVIAKPPNQRDTAISSTVGDAPERPPIAYEPGPPIDYILVGSLLNIMGPDTPKDANTLLKRLKECRGRYHFVTDMLAKAQDSARAFLLESRKLSTKDAELTANPGNFEPSALEENDRALEENAESAQKLLIIYEKTLKCRAKRIAELSKAKIDAVPAVRQLIEAFKAMAKNRHRGSAARTTLVTPPATGSGSRGKREREVEEGEVSSSRKRMKTAP